MGLLTAREKLDILVKGKATLKELNELEKQAEQEPTPAPEQEPTPAPEQEPTPEQEPDEKDLKIAELEAKLKEAQKANVTGNSGGTEPSFDEQLDNMFKDYRY